MLHIPILRKGRPYRSLDVQRAVHHRTREPFVEISQANVGLIRRDLLDQQEAQKILAAFTTTELMAMSRQAAEYFANDKLPLGDLAQTPQDYVEQVSATTGLPWVMVRRNMQKIRGVLAEIETVVRGLTRMPDLSVLDAGFTEYEGLAMSFFPRGDSLGVVLPSNSPGVHSLWAPAIALKTPLLLKPGSAEPWTPYRMIQAFMKAGVPGEVFGYYPTDHAGAGEILRRCGRGMLFGDVGAAKMWKGDPRIEIHGPGYSKIVFGEDMVDDWEKYIDVMVDSISQNSGRSCVNASGVWTPRHGARIADALAQRLAKIEPRSASDEQAQIAPFADPAVAERLTKIVEQDLDDDACDVTAKYRSGGRLAKFDGCSYLLPTVVHCNSPEHALANREFLFPFASVVEAPESEMPEILGPSLVVTALTANSKLIGRFLNSPLIGRLNLGPISTMKIAWDQPHEGNLFDHLYSRRAFQSVLEPVMK